VLLPGFWVSGDSPHPQLATRLADAARSQQSSRVRKARLTVAPILHLLRGLGKGRTPNWAASLPLPASGRPRRGRVPLRDEGVRWVGVYGDGSTSLDHVAEGGSELVGEHGEDFARCRTSFGLQKVGG
jgi:hypothetical protein